MDADDSIWSFDASDYSWCLDATSSQQGSPVISDIDEVDEETTVFKPNPFALAKLSGFYRDNAVFEGDGVASSKPKNNSGKTLVLNQSHSKPATSLVQTSLAHACTPVKVKKVLLPTCDSMTPPTANKSKLMRSSLENWIACASTPTPVKTASSQSVASTPDSWCINKTKDSIRDLHTPNATFCGHLDNDKVASASANAQTLELETHTRGVLSVHIFDTPASLASSSSMLASDSSPEHAHNDVDPISAQPWHMPLPRSASHSASQSGQVWSTLKPLSIPLRYTFLKSHRHSTNSMTFNRKYSHNRMRQNGVYRRQEDVLYSTASSKVQVTVKKPKFKPSESLDEFRKRHKPE